MFILQCDTSAMQDLCNLWCSISTIYIHLTDFLLYLHVVLVVVIIIIVIVILILANFWMFGDLNIRGTCLILVQDIKGRNIYIRNSTVAINDDYFWSLNSCEVV